VIENNLVNNVASGLNLYDTPGARIINNTIWGTGDFGLRMSQMFNEMNGVVLANNIIDKSWTTAAWLAVDVANKVDGNPLFGTLFELTSTSPALNTASATYAPATDRLGRPRVGAPDVGSQERQGL